MFSSINFLKKIGYIIAILTFGYFFCLMLLLTLEYIPIRSDASFLMIKQTEVTERPKYLSIFYTHVYSSIVVLLTGFLAILRPKFLGSKFHIFTGTTYIVVVLLLSAPSGIYIGLFANGGFLTKFSFIILGILWWFCTFKAYQYIKKRKLTLHKQWMWRSFALALSAITLRIWKVVIVHYTGMSPMDVYQIIAWLGWVPNLLIVEYLIKQKVL